MSTILKNYQLFFMCRHTPHRVQRMRLHDSASIARRNGRLVAVTGESRARMRVHRCVSLHLSFALTSKLNALPPRSSTSDHQHAQACASQAGCCPSATKLRGSVGRCPGCRRVLSAAIWATYGRAIHAPLIFDDANSVNENPTIEKLWPLVGDAKKPGPLSPVKDSVVAGRPLVNLSLAVNYYFGGKNTTGYHIFNIIVHTLSATLVWAIVRRTLLLDYFGGRFQQSASPLALMVAIVWALHPLQTEAVQYITQRTELMMGLFYLATLYASLRYFTAEPGKERTLWMVAAGLTCFLGAACKEVIVSAPVMVLVFQRIYFRLVSPGRARCLEVVRLFPAGLGFAVGAEPGRPRPKRQVFTWACRPTCGGSRNVKRWCCI